MPKPNTIKPHTVMFIACALIACVLLVPLWPISTMLSLLAAYLSYKGE